MRSQWGPRRGVSTSANGITAVLVRIQEGAELTSSVDEAGVMVMLVFSLVTSLRICLRSCVWDRFCCRKMKTDFTVCSEYRFTNALFGADVSLPV